MSDFRDRLGIQLSAASAELAAVAASDLRVRFGAQLTRAAGELAAARLPAAEPARARWLPRLPTARVPALALGDFRARFALQLTRAAGELAAGRHADGHRRRAARRAPWLTRPIAVGLAFVVFAGTALAAVAIWTPLLGNPQYGYNPGVSTSPPPQDELDALAVLRRPQTDADRGALTQAALTYINNYTTGVRTAYVRLLASGDGESFVLVPVEERKATAPTGGAPGTSTPLANALCLYASEPSENDVSVFCWSLAEIQAGEAEAVFINQLVGLAPDGASTATLGAIGGTAPSAPVQDNFFDIAFPSSGTPPLLKPAVTFSGTTG